MKIEKLSDLKALITLCRKTGVKDIIVDGISFSLSDLPRRSVQIREAKRDTRKVLGPSGLIDVPTELLPPEVIETPDELTAEQMLFYSAGDPQGDN